MSMLTAAVDALDGGAAPGAQASSDANPTSSASPRDRPLRNCFQIVHKRRPPSIEVSWVRELKAQGIPADRYRQGAKTSRASIYWAPGTVLLKLKFPLGAVGIVRFLLFFRAC
jgi:hypothetical protein